ncbi:MAG: hydrogenase formation protein HypD [Alphaproteobacteria bacterium]|nr:hydrogenase formation protein HypD [Alphaproteobacteria bacterium]TAD89160.1 MAG: hydrogenase formation protein HypD [Alphaproteobacteria bacterium]
MKYVSEFRRGDTARTLAAAIDAAVPADRHWRIMEFCGGHTHSICRFGLTDLLPERVELVHGPGCPVCVLPIGRLDQAIDLALTRNAILCSFGDMIRVPASHRTSLMSAKARGADIRVVYGPQEALKIARAEPEREVVFFAIGFETTAPTTALAVKEAAQTGIGNFSILCNHVLTPAALTAILEGGVAIDGFVGPGHVSTITGTRLFEPFAALARKPVVVAGFEPLDLLQAILMVVRQLADGRAEVENQYARAVSRDGNAVAQALMAEVFTLRPEFDWRGLGTMPDSALTLADRYACFDAERRFNIGYASVADHKACACADIVRGLKKPQDCKVFGTACTPQTPIGACMVSPEGSCAAYYAYGRHREPA